jgi:hypothetical protein
VIPLELGGEFNKKLTGKSDIVTTIFAIYPTFSDSIILRGSENIRLYSQVIEIIFT